MSDDVSPRLGLRSPDETAHAVTGSAPVAAFGQRRAQLAVYRAMAHNPELLNAWLPLCDYFLETPGLDPRDREVLILRTAYRCDSAYEWGKHPPKADDVGLAAQDLAALATAAAEGLDPWLTCLVAFADELHETSTVGDDTWDRVVRHLGEPLAFTCLMLVGQYHMLAYALNGAGITREPQTTERELP